MSIKIEREGRDKEKYDYVSIFANHNKKKERVSKKPVLKYLISMLFILIIATSISAIPQTINIHGKLSNSSGPISGTHEITFNIYNLQTGGISLYQKSTNIVFPTSGVYNTILTDVDLDFSQQYYLGITVENDEEMSLRINLTSSPYAYMAQNISVSGINFNETVNINSKNIETTGTGFFGFLGSLATRISKLWVNEINATGNIKTSGNVTAEYFIGDGYQLTNIDLSGIDISGINGSTQWTTSGSDIYYNTGNVGIGTSIPSEKLEVNGSVKATSFIGDGSQLTGINGMDYTNLALTNKSNTFTESQTINADINITGNIQMGNGVTMSQTNGSVIIKLGSA